MQLMMHFERLFSLAGQHLYLAGFCLIKIRLILIHQNINNLNIICRVSAILKWQGVISVLAGD